MERLNELKGNPHFERFWHNEIKVNGESYPGLDATAALIEEQALKVLCTEPPALSIIHGDLCLANILFDPRSRAIKLIDPRGSFGACTIHGDYRYDLAKLSHSFNGHYESIINDLFNVEARGNEINFNFHLTRDQTTITTMFNRALERNSSPVLKSVRLIEALLFLSMIPLHADFPKRQLIMLGAGIQKFFAAMR